jgi:hypothetical protein
MPKTGRPPMTQDQVRQRIEDYRAEYGVKDLNEDGFPVYPAGLRETKQHREWITLYKLFSRSKSRAMPPAQPLSSTDGVSECPVCLQPARPKGKPHDECAAAVDLVRKLGLPVLDRIRAEAFPDDAGTVGRAAVARRKR